GDVLEVRLGLGDGSVDRRLVLGIEAEGLGKAAVLGRHDAAVRHPGDEVVLDRERAVLPGERRRRLARPREADDQADTAPAAGRDDLAARMQRPPAPAWTRPRPPPSADPPRS